MKLDPGITGSGDSRAVSNRQWEIGDYNDVSRHIQCSSPGDHNRIEHRDSISIVNHVIRICEIFAFIHYNQA